MPITSGQNAADRHGLRGATATDKAYRIAVCYIITCICQYLMIQGNCPYIIPLGEWDVLWLTRAQELVAFAIKARVPSLSSEKPRRFWLCAGRAPQHSRQQPAGAGPEETRGGAMNAQELLQEISEYCRQTGLAESTFGRRAVNDGKLASRLRHGGRITTETLDRIRTFMATNRNAAARPAIIPRALDRGFDSAVAAGGPLAAARPAAFGRPCRCRPAARAFAGGNGGTDPQRNFRFFDNRQKYLLFVNTCSEKWVVAHRVSLELANIHPRPPALRAVRCRRRRRHRAAAGDARDARPLPAHAVLYRRQGDQPRGRAPRHAEDVGPLHRASGDRAGADQPRLCRRAVAACEVAVGGLQHGLARGGADRLVRRTSSSSRSPTWCRS